MNDRKAAFILSISALCTIAVMLICGLLYVPFSVTFSLQQDYKILFLKIAVTLVSFMAYIILHEAVHGIFMKIISGVKPHFGIKLPYVYAGSAASFTRNDYIIIALAPLIFWGIVLFLLNISLPLSWFWVIYLIQVFNVSGAAGDVYVTGRALQFSKDILVQDDGVKMMIYAPSVFPHKKETA